MKINLDRVLDKVKSLPQDYWIKAFKDIEKDRLKQIEDIEKEFVYLFELTHSQIVNEINLYFSKYAVKKDSTGVKEDSEDIINETANNTPLTRAELAETKAKMKSIESELKEYGLEFDKDINEKIKKLDSKTTRLEALKLVLTARIFSLYTLLGDHIYHHIENITDGSYSHTLFEVFKACGYGTKDIKALTDDEIAVILAMIWRATDETFDDVVWRYGRMFAVELTQYIGRATFSQNTLDDIRLYVDKRFGVKQNELDLLLRTDSTYYATQGETEACTRLEITEAVFTAIIDERTSDFCLEADGNIIPIDDIRPWENAPPLHYYCRSTLVPVVREVDFLTGDIYEIDTDEYDGWYEQYYKE